MTDADALPEHDARPDGPHSKPDVVGTGFPSIIIQGHALARIEAEMGADTGAEFGGVLVGNAAPSTNFVLVTGSLPAPQVGQRLALPDEQWSDQERDDTGTAPTNFTFSAEVLESLGREVAATYPGQRIVGWYHSHPRLGVFMSADDLHVQGAFFAQPWQVGYVYDPVKAQRGFFGWSGREIVRVPNWEVTSITHASGAELPIRAPGDSTVVESGFEPPAPSDFADAGGSAFPDPAGDADQPVPIGEVSTVEPSRKKRPIFAIIAAAAAILGIVIAVIVISSGDDEKSSTTTITSNDSSILDADSTPGTEPTVTPVTESASTAAPTTTTAATSTSASSDDTVVATPTSVSTPASRAGPSSVACEQTAADSYEPIADCFVPLNNGNVLLFQAGSLRCTEPAGLVLAAEAQTFTVGVPADPLVLVADDDLIATCTDLTYAKSVLAGGADILDGLCGSSGTQINDGTRRCLGQNLTSGAVVAIVRGTSNQSDLVASCTTADAEKSSSPITWSDNDVSTAWRVDSVIFDTQRNRFSAAVSRNGATATATINCG